MPILFQYLLKLTISLAIMYLFYLLILRRLTFYNHNRWYLFGYSVLCYLISFINIGPILGNGGVDDELINLVPSVGTLAAAVATDPSLEHGVGDGSSWSWIAILLVSGAVILVTRLIVQLISFKRLKSDARLITESGIKFYQVNRDIIPFSFGNSIYINQNLHTESELKEIIRHEFVHVKQNHTLDIIWGELLCIFNWYNPFAWLIKKAIRQNLEFIADNKVIANGVDKKQYQYLLLKVIGNNHFSIASQFNFSSLKKRIVMMNKIKSARVHLLKFLFILPLLAVLLLAFRNKLETGNSREKEMFGPESARLTAYEANIQKVEADTVPSEGKADIYEVVAARSLHRNDKMGQEHKNFFNRNPEINLLHWKENGDLEVYLKTGKFILYSTPADFKKFEKLYGPVPSQKESSKVEIKEVELRAVPVSPVAPAAPPAPISPAAPPAKPVEPAKIGVRISNNVKADANAKPLVIVDGKEWPADMDINLIDADKIEKVNVLKDEAATSIYGKKGKNGVILISTKKQGHVKIRQVIQDEPIYYLNGKKISKEAVELLDPAKIQSIDVLKGNKAAEKYGEEARKGAVDITMPVAPTTLKQAKPLLPAWDIKNIMPVKKKDEC